VPFNALGDGSAGAQTAELNPVVRSASRWDTSPPLRDLALNQPETLAPDQALEIPLHSLPKSLLESAVPKTDPVVQKSFPGVSAPPTTANFEGLDNVNKVLPPDTNGDIGPNHYVQIVNLSFAVYNRNGNLLLGPLNNNMLVGGEAHMFYGDLDSVDPNLYSMLPADLDGPPPPQGSPNPFVMMDAPDQLQVWNFSVNWSAPSASFTFQNAVPTASFDSNMCGGSRNCIPQPGGTNVDAISDRLMYRLQYRNFGDHQSLVVNHTVDTGGDRAGVRWYEMRKTGGGWSIFQQGTWAPDSDHRWMGSVAMNSKGDIGLGYSVSSTTTYPSIRFTGRLAEDPPGQMTFSEGEIITGSGYQTSSYGRWGDYSMMAVDPVDDCTFWYTQEYYAVIGNRPWQTRIASFKLRDCTNPMIFYFPIIYN